MAPQSRHEVHTLSGDVRGIGKGSANSGHLRLLYAAVTQNSLCAVFSHPADCSNHDTVSTILNTASSFSLLSLNLSKDINMAILSR
jgi:hypothetical protein